MFKKIISGLFLCLSLVGLSRADDKTVTEFGGVTSSTEGWHSIGQAAIIQVNRGETFSYSYTGTSTATYSLQQSEDGANWVRVPGVPEVTSAGLSSGSGTIFVESPSARSMKFRFNVTTYSAGSITFTLSDINDLVNEFKNSKKLNVMTINDESINTLAPLNTGVVNFSSVIYSNGQGVVQNNVAASYATNANETFITNCQDADGYAKASGNGTWTIDTSTYAVGAAAWKIAQPGDSVATRIRKTYTSPIDFTGKYISAYVKFDTLTSNGNFELYLATDTTFSPYYKINIGNSGYFSSYPYISTNTWTRVTVPWGSGTTVGEGTVPRDQIKVVQLVVRDNPGAAMNFWLGGIATVPEPSQGIVSITMDDGWATQFTKMAPVLSSFSIPSTAYIIKETLNANASYMTTSQVNQLHDILGWEIAGHALTNLTSETTTQVELDLWNSKDLLIRNNWSDGADNFAYPNGAINDDVKAMVGRYYRTGRTVMTQPTTASPWLETLPPADPLKLRAVLMSPSVSTATVAGYIDRAKNEKQWLILIFHKMSDVANPSDTLDYQVSSFTAICKYIKDSGIRTATVRDVLKMSSAINTIQNGSFVFGNSVSYGNFSTKTANYVVTSTETVILASTTAAGMTVRLPSSNYFNKGRVLTISKVDQSTGAVVILSSGTDVIAGKGTVTLNSFMQTDSIMADGMGHWIPWGQGLQMTPDFVGPGFQGTSANTIGTTSAAVCGVFTTQVPVTLSTVTVHVAVASGNMDAGVYDILGNRLASSGSVAVPAAGRGQLAMTSRVNLSPGTYWMCISVDNTTATLSSATGTTHQFSGYQSCSGVNLPLPATLSFPCGFTTRLVNFNMWGYVVGGSQ